MHGVTTVYGFNSIKVRLNHSAAMARYGIQMFQFHKGTIKRAYGMMASRVFLCFNSIKVRLNPSHRTTPLQRTLVSIP